MRDAVEHPSDRQEPGGEERGCPPRPQSRNRGDPDPEPRQVEDDEDGERNAWQAEQGPQPLVKAGRRLLGEVDALNPDCKSERTCGGESLRHVLGRRPTATRSRAASVARPRTNMLGSTFSMDREPPGTLPSCHRSCAASLEGGRFRIHG